MLDPPTIWLPLICWDDGMTQCSFFNPRVQCSLCYLDHSQYPLGVCGSDWNCLSHCHFVNKHFLHNDCWLFLCISGSGGFIFKQWKKRFLLITAEGSLLVCHDASSPPSQLVLLQNSCEAIVEGKEILDLPKLPSGGGRDCCFALILPQNKYLLLLAETSAECRCCGAFSANSWALF